MHYYEIQSRPWGMKQELDWAGVEGRYLSRAEANRDLVQYRRMGERQYRLIRWNAEILPNGS